VLRLRDCHCSPTFQQRINICAPKHSNHQPSCQEPSDRFGFSDLFDIVGCSCFGVACLRLVVKVRKARKVSWPSSPLRELSPKVRVSAALRLAALPILPGPAASCCACRCS
jgi:hypothetical protein